MVVSFFRSGVFTLLLLVSMGLGLSGGSAKAATLFNDVDIDIPTLHGVDPY
jgi:hypothetical protein